jgi:hypothetical protein
LLFLVKPKNVINVCTIDRRAVSICDKNFYHKYIQRNFNPKFYGLEEFVLPSSRSNWKCFFHILVNAITLPAEILTCSDNPDVLNFGIKIRYEDTLKDIWDNFKKIVG